MTMDRRTFGKRSLLALGGVLVGNEALEVFDRLNHRKVWAGHAFGPDAMTATEIVKNLRYQVWLDPQLMVRVQKDVEEWSKLAADWVRLGYVDVHEAAGHSFIPGLPS